MPRDWMRGRLFWLETEMLLGYSKDIIASQEDNCRKPSTSRSGSMGVIAVLREPI
jgi:hypothetical protein